MASIAAIFPCRMVTPRTSCRRPRGATTARHAVEQHKTRFLGAALKGLGHRGRTAELARPAHADRGRIAAHHHLRIEQTQQCIEIALPRGGEESFHHLAVCAGLCPSARPARGGGRGWQADGWRRWSGRQSARCRRTAGRTCRATQRRCARPAPAPPAPPAWRAHRWHRPVRVPRRDPRPSRVRQRADRRRPRGALCGFSTCPKQMRATTVVSQAGQVIPPCWCRRASRRSQLSCTASSASAREPSMR